ncbi:MAG: oligosaccharide flippase family protein [Bacteroidales bacterium]|nr:oligosaccharide flippase family protein [Bacteroidales bacterium]MDE6083801.1 oligosaccharide flippase family protein [Muribaculaceae bacterium]
MNFIKNLIKSQAANQAGLLLLATVSNIITQIIINALLARSLSQEEYGNYSYFINLFTFCQTVFNFGFFYTICRLVSISKDSRDARIYYYEGLKYLFVLSLLMILVLYAYSFIELSDLRKNGIEKVFWIITPFSFVYLITNYNEQIFQGNNKIKELAISRGLPKFVYAFLLIVVFFCRIKVRLEVFLILYLCSHLAVYIYLINQVSPIRDKVSRFKEIYTKNKKFGINIYLGALLSVGVANLMGLIISKYCNDNVELGFYNIALQISVPLTLIPNILSTVFFAKFASNHLLTRNLVIGVVVISLFLYTILFIFSDIIISIVFGASYLPAAKLIKILGLGSLLYGIADFFNRFILAKGESNIIRNIATTVGISYLLFGFLLIPKYLAEGASYAKVLTGIIYLTTEAICTKIVISKARKTN